MASKILPMAMAEIRQYRLPEADRQAILAKSDSALERETIERQRVAFVQRNGSEFGQEQQPRK